MGKSQRYQAAVDGHLSRHIPLEQSEKVCDNSWRPEPEYGLYALSTDSWGWSGDCCRFV